MQEKENIKHPTLASTEGDQSKILKDKKDIWDIIGAVGMVLGSVVAASAMVFVAIVGARVNTLTTELNRNFQEQEFLAREADLQSSRESAENQLRGSVFSSVGQYVAPLLSDDDHKLAILAGLHTNFSALYDTRPVFAAFSRDIKGVGSRQELKRLAKRAARFQVESLRSEGGIETQVKSLGLTYSTVDMEPVDVERVFTMGGHKFHLWVEKVYRYYGSEGDGEISDEEIVRCRDPSDDTVDDVTDLAFVVFSEVDRDDQLEFELSYMDSPYIDNISFFEGYATHHKLAFVLGEVDEVGKGKYEINIDAVHFPAALIPTYRVPLSNAIDEDHAVDEDHAEE